MMVRYGVFIALILSIFLPLTDAKAQDTLKLGYSPQEDLLALDLNLELHLTHRYDSIDTSYHSAHDVILSQKVENNTRCNDIYIGDNWLPVHVRQNPAGYSFLCRLEREIEKNIPVGLWVRVGEENPWEFYNRQQMYVQVKLLGFR